MKLLYFLNCAAIYYEVNGQRRYSVVQCSVVHVSVKVDLEFP